MVYINYNTSNIIITTVNRLMPTEYMQKLQVPI